MKIKIKSLFLTTILFTLSCMTDSNSLPEWIINYPKMPSYFIGIGGANSGDLTIDPQAAYYIALSNLAASISVSLESEMTLLSRENSGGVNEIEIKQNITEYVKTELKGIETYDSHYSPREGSWVFLRLSKSNWIQSQTDLKNRILALYRETLESSSISYSQIISSLEEGLRLLQDSPHYGTILLNNSTNSIRLVDYLSNELLSYFNDLKVESYINVERIESGVPLPIKINISTKKNVPIGRMKVAISGLERDHIYIADLDEYGEYNGYIPSNQLGIGNVTLTSSLHLNVLNDFTYLKTNLPKSTNQIDIDPAIVQLNIKTTPTDIEISNKGLYISLFDELIENPIELSEVNNPSYKLKLDFVFTDFPINKSIDLRFTKVRLDLDFIHNDISIRNWSSETVKDGGGDFTQARERAIDKLFNHLRNSEDLIEIIKDVYE